MAFVCDVLQEKLVLVSAEELAYIMIYIIEFFLPKKAFNMPEFPTYQNKVDEIHEEVAKMVTGRTPEDLIKASLRFGKTNLVVPIKATAVPKGKATVEKY